MKKIMLFLVALAVFCMNGSVAFAGFDGSIAKEKDSEIDTLSDLLLTGNDKTDKRIEKAIAHINKSLNPDFWDTDSTLTKKGKKVFDEEKKAVKELMKIEDIDVSESIDSLVSIDKTLAKIAIGMATITATAAGCYVEGNDDPECDKPLKEIDKAEDEMGKAQEELDHMKKDGTLDPKYDKAIDHYKKAWEHAQKAMKKLSQLEYEAGDLDNDGDIDGDDFFMFLSAFGTCEGDGDYNAACDYDGDNCITLIDLQIWYGYYIG